MLNTQTKRMLTTTTLKFAFNLKINSSQAIHWLLLCFSLILFTSFSTAGLANSDKPQRQQTQEKLLAVQQAIKKKQQGIAQQKAKQTKVEQRLKATDLAIGKAAKILRKTQQQEKTVRTQLGKTKNEIDQLEQDKQQQLKVLAEQIKSAYQVGQHDYLMLLLNQESPGKLERVLTYYQYLNQARVKLVDDLKQTITRLDQLAEQLASQRLELVELKRQQKQQEAELVKLKQQQKQDLAKIAKKISNEQKELNKLKQNEQLLSETLAALSQVLAELPEQDNLHGLQQYKGRLPWPTRGKVQHLFGKRKRGPLKWKGIQINGRLGRTVQNIHAGQVIFSDWMKGFGLVMVIDHGRGFMSLYGHNQTLLKNVGDIVEAGEAIALVGQSGGQANPKLYFEIRHKGQPLNPRYWCR